MVTIDSVLQEHRVFPPSAATVARATISGMAQYEALCKEAEADYAGYWARLAREHLIWKKPFSQSLDETAAPFYKWFEDGTLNVSFNCLDRNLENGNSDKTALIFEADDGKVTRTTYRELHALVCRFANGLKSRGIKKGDRAIIYMPMSVEGVAAMQACARIGAIHSVVFGGFSAKSVQERVVDAGRDQLSSPPTNNAAAARTSHSRSWTKLLPWAAARPSTASLSIAALAMPLACWRIAMCGCTICWQVRARTASRNGLAPSIRCSCSTPRARPANRRVCSIRRAVICCTPS